MATINDLIPEVRTHLKGAPDATVRLYLRRAAKQFCQDSRVWDVSLGSRTVSPPTEDDAEIEIPIPSTGDDPDFALPEQSVLNRISRVKLGKDNLRGPQYRYDRPTAMLILSERTVMEEATLAVYGILEPTKSATAIPDFIAELWSEGIVDYAIFEMMMMPGQEWSDRALAAVFNRKYGQRVAEATVDKAREGTDKGIRLEPIPFV